MSIVAEDRRISKGAKSDDPDSGGNQEGGFGKTTTASPRAALAENGWSVSG